LTINKWLKVGEYNDLSGNTALPPGPRVPRGGVTYGSEYYIPSLRRHEMQDLGIKAGLFRVRRAPRAEKKEHRPLTSVSPGAHTHTNTHTQTRARARARMDAWMDAA